MLREGDATFDLICGMQVSAYTTGETVQGGGILKIVFTSSPL